MSTTHTTKFALSSFLKEGYELFLIFLYILQAMLRKTNTNRASLRRVRNSEDSGSRTQTPNYLNMNGNTTIYNNVDNNRNKHGNTNGYTRGNNNNYESTPRNENRNINQNNSSGRTDYNQTNSYSKPYNQNSYSRSDNQNNNYSRPDNDNYSRPSYQRTNSNDLLTQSRNNLNRTTNGYSDRVIRAELAPGIIVEGVVVDLWISSLKNTFYNFFTFLIWPVMIVRHVWIECSSKLNTKDINTILIKFNEGCFVNYWQTLIIVEAFFSNIPIHFGLFNDLT